MNSIKNTVRGIVKEIAILLDAITNGHIRPNHVTIFSVVGHIIVMLSILDGKFNQAALLLIVFGLMDTLDGELARIQKSGTDFGALLDAVSDRVKETLIYTGFAVYFARIDQPLGVALATLALGFSISVSYTKAKLETTLASQSKQSITAVTKQLAKGIFQFEVRMTLLVVGLLLSLAQEVLLVIVLGAAYTLMERLYIGYRLYKTSKKDSAA